MMCCRIYISALDGTSGYGHAEAMRTCNMSHEYQEPEKQGRLVKKKGERMSKESSKDRLLAPFLPRSCLKASGQAYKQRTYGGKRTHCGWSET